MTCKGNGKKVSVLSPHYDDTVFSLGGFVSKYVDEFDWKIIDVFGRQDYTLYSRFYESNKNRNFAFHEEKVAMAIMGLESFEHWDIEEALLRGAYSGYGFLQTTAQPEEIVQAEIDCYNHLCNQMRSSQNLNECEIILCPLCIGHHVDHVLVRQACIQLYFGKKVIVFYEELPYALGYSPELVSKWLNGFLGEQLKQNSVEISQYALQKKYLARIYQSQIRAATVESMISHGMHEGQYYEHLWTSKSYENNLFLTRRDDE